METIPCPGCRTDLDPSATVCPICLRPRGKVEITRAYATLRELEKQRKKRPFVIAGRLLAAAAIGGGLFRYHEPILSAAARASASGSQFANDLLYPPVAKSPAAPPPQARSGSAAPGDAAASASAFPSARARSAAATSPPSTDARPPADARSQPSPESPTADSHRRPARVEDLPMPSFDPSTQWAFYGRAFDLISLRPVAYAQLSFNVLSGFKTGADLALSVRTDEDGRFMAVLGRLTEGSSYEIRASRPGYASPVLYESDIPYATLPAADRREIVRGAQDGDTTLPPLTDIAGEPSVRRDIFLAPSR